MITILIQIDDSLEKGMLSYESGKAETACFISQDNIRDILLTVREAVKDAEVI